MSTVTQLPVEPQRESIREYVSISTFEEAAEMVKAAETLGLGYTFQNSMVWDGDPDGPAGAEGVGNYTLTLFADPDPVIEEG